MKGWGRVTFLLVVGVFLGAGCGGRTSSLDSDYGPDGSGADGYGADGSGANGSGGVGQGGTTGPRPVGGTPSIAGSGPSYGGTIAIGGTGVYPGGSSYGGYPAGG